MVKEIPSGSYKQLGKVSRQNEGLTLRFQSYFFRLGGPTFTFANRTSYTWMLEIVEMSRPWNDARLKAIQGEEEDLYKQYICVG